jgi:predicted small metal-binding protein
MWPHSVWYVVWRWLSFEGRSATVCRRIFKMTRELRCADLILDCDFVAHGKHDSDVMKKVAEHAKRAHRMIAIGMEIERKARAAIRDVVGELAAGT